MDEPIIASKQYDRIVKVMEKFRKTLIKSFKHLDEYYEKTNFSPKEMIIDSLKDDIFQIQENINNCFIQCKLRDTMYTEGNKEDCIIKCVKMGEINLLENEFKYTLIMQKGGNHELKSCLNDSFEFKQRQLNFDILKKYL